MTTNKDFQDFQKFLTEQKQLKEGPIGTAITGYMGYETGSAIKDKRYGDAVSSGLGMLGGPVGWAAVTSDVMGKAAKTEKGKAQGEWVRKNVPGAETVANYMRKAGEAIGIREPSKSQEPEQPNEPEQPASDMVARKVQSIPITPPTQQTSTTDEIVPRKVKTTIERESGGRTIKSFKQFHKNK